MKLWRWIGLASKKDIEEQKAETRALNQVLLEIKENQENIKNYTENFNSKYIQEQKTLVLEVNTTYSNLLKEFNNLKSDFNEQLSNLTNQQSLKEEAIKYSFKSLSSDFENLEKFVNKALSEDINSCIQNASEDSKRILKSQHSDIKLLNQTISDFKENQELFKKHTENFNSKYIQKQKEFALELNNVYDNLYADVNNLKLAFNDRIAELVDQQSLKEESLNTSFENLSSNLKTLEKHITKTFNEDMQTHIKKVTEKSKKDIDSRLDSIEESSKLLLINSLIKDTNDAVALMKTKK